MSAMHDPAVKPSCPVLIGPGVLDLIRGRAWMFLMASIALHFSLVVALPQPGAGLAALAQQELLIKLKPDAARPRVAAAAPLPVPPAPPATPTARPSAAPAKPSAAPPAAPASQVAQAAPAGPAAGSTGPGEVIAVPGSGSGGATPVPSGPGSGWGSSSGSGAPGTGGGVPGGIPGGTGDAPAAPPKPAPLPPQPPAPKPQPKPEPAIDVKALLATYASGVKSSIVRHKAYPAIAERLGHEGSVKVGFTVDASGSLGSVAVKSSSGYDELDNAALDAVRAAAPFEPIPEDTGKDHLSLSITLNFSLGS